MAVEGRRGVILFVAAIGGLTLAAACTAAQPPRLFGQAGRTWQIGTLRFAETASVRTAEKALGPSSSCSSRGGMPVYVFRRWPDLGLRITFVGTPTRTPCSDRSAILDEAFATGSGWRTPAGLRIGDRLATLRDLYPNATSHSYRRGPAQLDGWWIVVGKSHFPDLHRYPKLLAEVRHGKVSGLVINFDLND